MTEENLQKQVCNYLRLQYPKVLFNSDLSGIKLTMGQAVKAKALRSSKGFPDLMIFEPKGKYHGLFIELKRDGEKIYKKDCTPVSEHVYNQIKLINQLIIKGYYASFCIGFDSAKKLIDQYLSI